MSELPDSPGGERKRGNIGKTKMAVRGPESRRSAQETAEGIRDEINSPSDRLYGEENAFGTNKWTGENAGDHPDIRDYRSQLRQEANARRINMDLDRKRVLDRKDRIMNALKKKGGIKVDELEEYIAYSLQEKLWDFLDYLVEKLLDGKEPEKTNVVKPQRLPKRRWRQRALNNKLGKEGKRGTRTKPGPPGGYGLVPLRF